MQKKWKIFESQGLQVSRLKRVRFGPIFLPKGLKEGDWQELKSKDLEKMHSYGKWTGVQRPSYSY